jgi:hypothetical protein
MGESTTQTQCCLQFAEDALAMLFVLSIFQSHNAFVSMVLQILKNEFII